MSNLITPFSGAIGNFIVSTTVPRPLEPQVAFTCNKAGWISIRLVQEKAKEKIDNVVQLIKITFPWGFT